MIQYFYDGKCKRKPSSSMRYETNYPSENNKTIFRTKKLEKIRCVGKATSITYPSTGTLQPVVGNRNFCGSKQIQHEVSRQMTVSSKKEKKNRKGEKKRGKGHSLKRNWQVLYSLFFTLRKSQKKLIGSP